MTAVSSEASKFRDAPRNVFGDFRMVRALVEFFHAILRYLINSIAGILQCKFVASGKRCDFGEGACTFAHSSVRMIINRRHQKKILSLL
jgi:hypothetical protein